jgi:small GTP-binding protein
MSVPPVKAILCGDTQVGKTTILQALQGVHEPTSPTMGAGFAQFSLNYDDEEVPIRLWDTAGQEAYRSLIKVYFRGVQIAYLVFDVTSRDSFSSLQDWLAFIRENCPATAKILLIANKIDLADDRAVSSTDLLDFAHKEELIWLEISAKTSENLTKFLELGYGELIGAKRPEPIPEVSDEPTVPETTPPPPVELVQDEQKAPDAKRGCFC